MSQHEEYKPGLSAAEHGFTGRDAEEFEAGKAEAKAGLRKFKVRVVIERNVDAETTEEAIASICGPIREALDDADVGISEVACTATDWKHAEMLRQVRRPEGRSTPWE